MKKLIAISTIALFVVIGCQEGSSIVAPDNGSTLDKKPDATQFIPTDPDSSGSSEGAGVPHLPRV